MPINEKNIVWDEEPKVKEENIVWDKPEKKAKEPITLENIGKKAVDVTGAASLGLSRGFTQEFMPHAIAGSAKIQEKLGLSGDDNIPYSQYLEGAREYQKDIEKENPITTGITSAVGSMATPGIGKLGAGKGLFKTAGVAGGLSGLQAVGMGKDTGDIAKSTLQGAVMGAGAKALPAVAGAVGRGVRRAATGVTTEAVKAYKASGGKLGENTREVLESSVGKAKEFVESAKDKAKFPVIDKIIKESQNLRGKISGESGEAFRTLGSSKIHDVKPLIQEIDNAIGKFRVDGRIPANKQADVSKLEGIREMLIGSGEIAENKISSHGLKTVVSNLNDDLSEIYSKKGYGGHLTQGEQAVDKIYKKAKGTLEEIPQYKEIMKPLAGDVNLSKEVAKVTGKRDVYKSTSNKLEKILDRGGKEDLAAVEKLVAQSKDPSLAKEFQTYKDTLAKFKQVEPINTGNASSYIDLAQKGSQKNFQKINQLKALGEHSGEDFMKKSHDLKLAEMFEKPPEQLSLAKGTQAAARSLMGSWIAPLGVALEGTAKLIGPQGYKKFLDFSMSPKFKPFVAAFEAAKTPQAMAALHSRLMVEDPEYRKNMGD